MRTGCSAVSVIRSCVWSAGAEMRGKDEVRGLLFSYVDLKRPVRRDHPLRVIRGIVNAALVPAQPKVKALLSTEHFSVDGTLLEAWASTKSFRPKDGSGPVPQPDGGSGAGHTRGRTPRAATARGLNAKNRGGGR